MNTYTIVGLLLVGSFVAGMIWIDIRHSREWRFALIRWAVIFLTGCYALLGLLLFIGGR